MNRVWSSRNFLQLHKATKRTKKITALAEDNQECCTLLTSNARRNIAEETQPTLLSMAKSKSFKDATGHFHDDHTWLQRPEFTSFLLYLNLSISLRFQNNSPNLHKKKKYKLSDSGGCRKMTTCNCPIWPHSSFNLNVFEHVYDQLMGIVSADYQREGFDWQTLRKFVKFSNLQEQV